MRTKYENDGKALSVCGLAMPVAVDRKLDEQNCR